MYTALVSKKFCKLLHKSQFWSKNEIFRLTLIGNDEATDQHFLNPDRISEIRECLKEVKEKAEASKTKRSVLITTAEGDYFSGGFDFSYAEADGGDGNLEIRKQRYLKMIDEFKGVVCDLISLPMPTIAAINGYTFGAGLMLGISHDYLTLTTTKNLPIKFDLLSQGMSLPNYFAAMIRSKLASPVSHRCLVLRELQFGSLDAAGFGLLFKDAGMGVEGLGVDAAQTAETLAEDLFKLGFDGKVYAEARKALYPELCKELGLTSCFILSNM